ncbi:MAG: class I SAM-dependent methyltransferase [Bacteroidales bacterium]|nr:class I SAM-dependent methyltransferase [Bacteroidales bacterium]
MNVKMTFARIIKKIFFEELFFYYNFLKPIESEFQDVETVLELGAGKSTYLSKLKNKNITISAIDAFQDSLEIAKKNNVYRHYYCGDVRDIDKIFKNNKFDAVVAFDLIEHLEKEDGYKLIEKMEKIAVKKVVILTPNGFIPQDAFDGNPFQKHLSGWQYEEMKELGFRITGVNGYHRLRGMYSKPVIRPSILGTFISNLSWLIIKVIRLEAKSFAIICFKNVK